MPEEEWEAKSVRVTWSAHAETRMKQRGLSALDMNFVALHPDRTEPDPGDRSLTRAFKRLGDKVLRVVYRQTVEEFLVTRHIITAFFDRGAKP